MKIEINDFIKYKISKEKYGFIQDINPLKVLDSKIKDEIIEINESDIISNYGLNPDFDSLKIDIYNEEYIVPVFGNVTEYKHLSDNERKELKKAFEEIKDLSSKFDCFPIYIQVKHNKGKIFGSYKYNKKEEHGDIILSPLAFEKENLKQIILHELGHAVWTENLSNNYKAKWIRLYDKNMERRAIKQQQIEESRKDFLESGLSIKEYYKILEDQDLFKKILKSIKDLYNLKPIHLDTLVSSGDDLTKYWPTESLELSDYNPFVSDYATKNVEEFFAESFMFYLLNMNLPESVRKAVKLTLESINVII